MDLAKTIVQMSGFDHMQIINSSKYDDLGKFSYPIFQHSLIQFQ